MLIGHYGGIEFSGGHQFWSNPAMVGSLASIPAVIKNPTFLDFVNLTAKHGSEALLEANERLHAEGQIKDFLYESNKHSIMACMRGKARSQQ